MDLMGRNGICHMFQVSHDGCNAYHAEADSDQGWKQHWAAVTLRLQPTACQKRQDDCVPGELGPTKHTKFHNARPCKCDKVQAPWPVFVHSCCLFLIQAVQALSIKLSQVLF